MTEYPQDLPNQQPSYGQQPVEPKPSYNPQPPQDSGGQTFQHGQAFQDGQVMTPADQRSWGIVTHLSPFLASFAGGLTFLGPLILYLVLRDRGSFIRHHSAETLNFQLTMWIGLLISVPLIFVVLLGLLTAAIIVVAMVVCHILGAVAASEGRDYRYPFTIRFVS